MKLYKLFVYLKETKKYFKGLWIMDKEQEYKTTLNTFMKAEKQGKCDIVFYGTTTDTEDMEQYCIKVTQ